MTEISIFITATWIELMIQKFTSSSRSCSSPFLPEQLRTRSASSSHSGEFADPLLTCNGEEKALVAVTNLEADDAQLQILN